MYFYNTPLCYEPLYFYFKLYKIEHRFIARKYLIVCPCYPPREVDQQNKEWVNNKKGWDIVLCEECDNPFSASKIDNRPSK